MKTILLLPSVFVLLFLVSSTFGQMDEVVKNLNLKGSVKRIESYYLVPSDKDENASVKKQISEIMSFNRTGQMVERLTYSSPNDLPVRAVYIYGKNGQYILSENYGCTSRNPVTRLNEYCDEFEYKYDKAGRIIERSEFSIPRMPYPKQRITLQYDLRGNVSEISHFDLNDREPTGRTTFSFDSQGRLDTQTKFGLNGTVISEITRTYNNKGLVNSFFTKDVEYGSEFDTYYEYDDKNRGLIATTKIYDKKLNPPGSAVSKVEYKYDDEKMTKEELAYSNGILHSKTTYKLDRYGNVLSKMEVLSEETRKQLSEIAAKPSNGLIPIEVGAFAGLLGMFAREAFSYEYDSRGNWIKRVEYEATEFVIGSDNRDAELKPVRTQVRTITYYN